MLITTVYFAVNHYPLILEVGVLTKIDLPEEQILTEYTGTVNHNPKMKDTILDSHLARDNDCYFLWIEHHTENGLFKQM